MTDNKQTAYMMFPRLHRHHKKNNHIISYYRVKKSHSGPLYNQQSPPKGEPPPANKQPGNLKQKND